LRSTEAKTISPVLAPAPPVDASARQRVGRALLVVDGLAIAILARGRRHRRANLRPVLFVSGNRRMSPTPPSMIWNSIDRSHGPLKSLPVLPRRPCACRSRPLSRERAFRSPHVTPPQRY